MCASVCLQQLYSAVDSLKQLSLTNKKMGRQVIVQTRLHSHARTHPNIASIRLLFSIMVEFLRVNDLNRVNMFHISVDLICFDLISFCLAYYGYYLSDLMN